MACWRRAVACTRAEAIPHPHYGEHVFFKAWLDRGFMSPRSRILWDLLFFFKLHPQDISPNLLLQVSMYTMAYKWYLSIEPSLLMSHIYSGAWR
jgi:hypothetical protein